MESNSSSTQLLVDLHGAAKLLGLSEKAIWNLAREGRIPSIKLGEHRNSRRMYSPAALQRWIEQAQAV